ncbi:hypothetical protein [Loigolactobacillus zhaoyuanensis]|uniref:HTH domain-containing protein n=1 Tax=Loigolactobacillus zhaoyuanensis TaxID=2486017 RepID=A0ABW8UBC6_9LACO
MFKEDLLDKQDRIMVSLLEQLYLADGAVSKQALSQQLSISVSSLNRYVNQLVLELQASITAGLVKLELTPNCQGRRKNVGLWRLENVGLWRLISALNSIRFAGNFNHMGMVN